MARATRFVSCLRFFAAFQSLTGLSRFSSAQTTSSPCGNCIVSLPVLHEYTWSPISYESSTTIDVTVATLVYLVDPAGVTSTSTQLATSTETFNVSIPTTTQTQNVTIYYGFDEAKETPLISTVAITYPTPFVDYGAHGAQVGYWIRTGQVSTSSSCLSATHGISILPTSHPIYPQPTTATAPNATDSLGYDYTLVRNGGSALPPGYDQAAFTSWYSASFSDQGAVVQCTANNSWISPLPSTTSISRSTSAIASSATQTISSTSCFTNNLTSVSCTTVVTYAQPPPPPSPSVSNKQSPEATTATAAGPSLSALTHTSVQYLTATSTSHVSTTFGADMTPGVSRSPTGEGGKGPTTSAPQVPPQSQQSGEYPASRTDGSVQAPSSQPGEPGFPGYGGGSGDKPRPDSTTFVVSAQPNTRVTLQPVTTVLTATSGQVITMPTTRISISISGSRTLTSSIRGSFTSTATGGEQLTLTTNQLATITAPDGTHVIQVPTTGVITATSGQVVVLPTTVSSTVISGSETRTTTFVSSYSTTATANEQITWTTNDLTTITGPVGTYVGEVPTSTVVTATSGEVFTIETQVLSTITSGTSTYVTSIPTSTVVTATSNGQLVTIATETQSTMTLPAGTYTTDVPGGPQSTASASGDARGVASEATRPSILLFSLVLTVGLLRMW